MIHGFEASCYTSLLSLLVPEVLAPFYDLSDPFPCPRPPVCTGLSSTVLFLCFRARWMWLRPTLSLGYHSCYPSPVIIASSNASAPQRLRLCGNIYDVDNICENNVHFSISNNLFYVTL